jgi:hypothetical protein
VYQLLAHVRWFSPGTPAFSNSKTGRHDIAEAFLKVALKHQKANQDQNPCQEFRFMKQTNKNKQTKTDYTKTNLN